MANITNELTTNFVFKGSLNPLNQYNASFSNAIGLMAKGIGVVTALNAAMFGMATSQLQAVDTLGQLSKETGISVEAIQRLGYVASVNGGSIDGLQNSLRGLSEKIGEASISGSEDFNRLGISVRDANGNIKSTEQVLNEVRHSFQGLNKAQQFSFAQKLGIDKSMLQTLNLTNAELDETAKKINSIGIVSQKDTEKVMAFNDSITTSKMALTAIGQQISLGMLPNMSNLVNSFNDFIFTNADLIKNGLSKTIYWFNTISSAVLNVGKVLYEFRYPILGVVAGLAVASGAVATFGKALLLNPLTLWVGAITAIVLAVDDLYVAFNGGQSVIKDFFGSFNIDIVNVLKTAFDGLKITFNGLLSMMLRVSEAFTSLVLLGGKAGNLLGLDIDTKGIENFKRMQEQTRLGLDAESRQLAQGITNRNLTTNQTVNITQNIQGSEATRIAELSSGNMKEALDGANAQIRTRKEM